MQNFGYQAVGFRSAAQGRTLKVKQMQSSVHFTICSLTFQYLDRDDLAGSEKEWAQRIDEFLAIDTTGAEAQAQWRGIAEKLSSEKKWELSR